MLKIEGIAASAGVAIAKAHRPEGQLAVPPGSLRLGAAPFDLFRGILHGTVEADFVPLNKPRGRTTDRATGNPGFGGCKFGRAIKGATEI